MELVNSQYKSHSRAIPDVFKFEIQDTSLAIDMDIFALFLTFISPKRLVCHFNFFLFLKLFFFSAWIKLQNIWISTPVESQLVAGSWVVHRRKRTRVPTWINLHCRCLRCRCLRCLRCRYAHKGSHLNQQVRLLLKPFQEIKDDAHTDCLKIETNKSLHNCTK